MSGWYSTSGVLRDMLCSFRYVICGIGVLLVNNFCQSYDFCAKKRVLRGNLCLKSMEMMPCGSFVGHIVTNICVFYVSL